jgi:hypothetical protein
MPSLQYPAGFFEETATAGEFGPFMSALLPRQRAFIIAYFQAGDGNAKAAAKAAGYAAKSDNSLKVHAYHTLHSPKVQAAMNEWARSRLQANAPAYLKELHYLATDRKAVKDEVRLKAALGGLNRAGLGGEININQNHSVVISFDEKLLELKRLAALAGDDPDKAIEGLVAPQDGTGVTDAEYEDIA